MGWAMQTYQRCTLIPPTALKNSGRLFLLRDLEFECLLDTEAHQRSRKNRKVAAVI